ncbi:hypothetical protein Mpe_B0068 (plasmid) [Methylibium petroleiphilum PM1]|uniref:Uncharacterized protein n=1 Tax=Methylibium petroleiphilum (strain ATCC BAA-1232 / LMG 22953 / PM1) TaxID=420662 RepID=A2SMQ8_METPP|nr:hypothetical protein Mpe_B0068 [Methylibium petroleiphilum PM1]
MLALRAEAYRHFWHRKQGDPKPVFFGLEFDPLTPGQVVSGRIIRTDDALLQSARCAFPDPEPGTDVREAQLAAVQAQARHLLALEASAFTLIGHARQALTWTTGEAAQRRTVECVAVRLVSVDRSVGSIFPRRPGEDRPRLTYSPPSYT